MIIALKLTYKGVTVEFTIHEVVEIARQLLPFLDEEEVEIPSLNDYFEKLQASLHEFRKTDNKTPMDLLPIAAETPVIPPVVRPAQWRYVASYINRADPRQGYWLNIDGRMLRIDKNNNYVSDYGIGFRGIDAASSLTFSNPTIPPEVFEKVEQKYKLLLESSASEGVSDPESTLDDTATTEDEKDVLFLYTMNHLAGIIEKLESSYDNKKKLDGMSKKNLEAMKIVKFLSENYRLKKEKSKQLNYLEDQLHEHDPNNALPPLRDFLNGIAQRSYEHKKFTDTLKDIIVIFNNLMKIASGNAEYLFRIDTFSNSSGASYQQFEPFLEQLLHQYKPHQIATFMRSILSGEQVQNMPICLPSLTAVWCIAEQSRDSLALLTNSIVLDFIEGDIPYLEDQINQYSWKSLLINSDTGKRNIKLNDIYGHKLKPPEKGGMYPAAHDGSYDDSNNEKHDAEGHLLPKIPLSWLRQKQGHLILHWLHVMIGKYCPMVKAEIVELDSVKGKKIPPNTPQYKEIIKRKDNNVSTVGFEEDKKNVHFSKEALRKKEKDQSVKLSDYRTFWNKRLVPLRRSQTKLTLQTQLIEPLLTLRMNSFEFCFSPQFDAEAEITLPMGFKALNLKTLSTEWYTEDKIINVLQCALGNNVTHVSQTQLEHTDLLKANLESAIGEVITRTIPAVIPVHVHGNHWTALIIKKVENGSIQVIYNDSNGNALESEENAVNLVKTITEICPDATILDLQLRQQFNDNDCGPFSIDNMVRIANINTEHVDRNALVKLLDKPMNGSAIHIRKEHERLLDESLQINFGDKLAYN